VLPGYARQGHFLGNWFPGGVRRHCGGFGPPWSGIVGARLRRHWQRTPVLHRNRGRAPNALATRFLLIAASILQRGSWHNLKAERGEEENWRKIVNMSGFLQC
jgi:hypothetical protein